MPLLPEGNRHIRIPVSSFTGEGAIAGPLALADQEGLYHDPVKGNGAQRFRFTMGLRAAWGLFSPCEVTLTSTWDYFRDLPCGGADPPWLTVISHGPFCLSSPLGQVLEGGGKGPLFFGSTKRIGYSAEGGYPSSLGGNANAFVRF